MPFVSIVPTVAFPPGDRIHLPGDGGIRGVDNTEAANSSVAFTGSVTLARFSVTDTAALGLVEPLPPQPASRHAQRGGAG